MIGTFGREKEGGVMMIVNADDDVPAL